MSQKEKTFWVPKWWGWGELDDSFDLSGRTNFLPFLSQFFSIPRQAVLNPPEMDEIQMPPTRFDTPQLQELEQLVGKEHCRFDPFSRLVHSVGKSYKDLLLLLRKQVPAFPDAVIFAGNEAELLSLFKWCQKENIILVPFGGGTSVVGGVEIGDAGDRPVLVVNLGRFDQIEQINPQNRTVAVQAGVRGMALEQALNKHGFTLGHFPESMIYSTVGGWLATRSAGQVSTFFGKIENLVESISVVTPSGSFESLQVPASAAGPPLEQLFLGNEGTLGIITRAVLKIRPLPSNRLFRAYLLPNFEEGVHLAHKLAGSSLKPCLLRLSDEIETEFAFALMKQPKGQLLRSLLAVGKKYLAMKGYKVGTRSLLLLSYEGDSIWTSAARKSLRRALNDVKYISLGARPVKEWFRHRFENPILRDYLLRLGFLVDTVETATEWTNILSLYSEVKSAAQKAFADLRIPGLVLCHLSHVYEQGSSLYFIFLAKPEPGEELSAWKRLKASVSEAIVSTGGTITHHHGIGFDHMPWFWPRLDPVSRMILKEMKKTLDPNWILNPGKLIPIE